ncbi:cadherin-like beta sandwich domain-containing protein [Paenibacillus ferrarius]|uniref:cadherin-like beta sandwich domain-containing protein n=1 Tax=Paenibacillus ferrarius TaxID=1469647 RepID=UPI003D28324A
MPGKINRLISGALAILMVLLSAFGVMPMPAQAAVSDWVQVSATDSGVAGFQGIIYDGTQFVAVGIGSYGSSYIGTSVDGYAWTRASAPNGIFQSVAYGNGVHVAVGSAIAASTDGKTYNAVGTDLSNTVSYLYSIVYGKERFVAVGWGGAIVTSTDGIHWSVVSSGTSNHMYGVTFGNGQFVAVGDSGTVLTSADGLVWSVVENQNVGFSSTMISVTYGNGYYVAVGSMDADMGAILTSADGTHWAAVSTPDVLGFVTYGEGRFVAVGPLSSVILMSTDGLNWTTTNTWANPFKAVAAANNEIIAVTEDYSFIWISDAAFKGLSVNYSGGTKAVSPTTSLDTYDYNVSVTSADPSITLTTVFAPAPASVKMSVYDANNNKRIDSVSLASGEPSMPIPLENGYTRIELDTSQKGITHPKRTITVYRPAVDSMNADLAGLTVGSGALSPAFSPGRQNYTVTANQPLSSLSITPTAIVPNASISVNGKSVASGQTATVDLAPGTNLIPVTVTATDGTTQKTYVLSVSGKTNNASLAGLSVNPSLLMPDFATDVHAYTIALNHSDTNLSITPTLSNSQATLTLNGTASANQGTVMLQPPVGISVVPIVVTAEDGKTTETYSLIVNRAGPSNNAALSGLTVSGGNIVFSPETRSYSLDVANTVSSMDITAAAADSGASLSIAGTSQLSGSSRTVQLAFGSTVIPIRVVAADGLTERTYLLTVNRAPLSNHAKLEQLLVNQGTLTPGFSPDTAAYSLKVAHSLSSISLTPASAPGNSITVENVLYNGQSAGVPVQLSVGTNIIPVMITAADGITTNTYVVVVERAAPSGNALLNRIEASSGTLSREFTPENSIYNVNVPYDTTSLTVSPVTQDVGAAITSIGKMTGAEAAQPIPLDTGITVIPIVVTAQDQVHKQTYVLIVNREGQSLQVAPVLTADSNGNDTASAIVLTFTDNEAWRSSITAVKVGTTELASGDYSITAGKITIRAGVLGIGNHAITIAATGYMDAAVTQSIAAAGLPYRIDEPQVTVTGLSATVAAAIYPLQASTNVPVTIIFQLMDGTAPLQVVAVKTKIQDSQEAAAQFNLPAAKNYTVKVMIWDDLQHQVSQATQKTKAIIVTP